VTWHDIALLCQWPAAAAGLLGALLVASQVSRTRMWGFVWFIVSDIFLAIYGWETSAWAIVALQVVWIATSIRGVWKNSPVSLTSK
jgi:hypothetical protein